MSQCQWACSSVSHNELFWDSQVYLDNNSTKDFAWVFFGIPVLFIAVFNWAFYVKNICKHRGLLSLPDDLLASSLACVSASSETDMVRFGSGIDNFQTCQKIASELESIPVLVYHKLSQRTPANGSHTERRHYIMHSDCLLCVSEGIVLRYLTFTKAIPLS